eukprot:TRINITY_DN10369_c0_g1_i1.p1 TRINITY_DN10369_c0_g1~~TRINITY_DN10369_c0_g1_i1.p1  ORF type:complete len:229 (+),score=31.39 TRINITY_DN10369_c0_g1_i1:117-803(+)
MYNTGAGTSYVTGSATSQLEERYRAAKRIDFDIQAQFEKLETCGNFAQSPELQGQISVNLNNLSKIVIELNQILTNQNQKQNRTWTIRVQQLGEQCQYWRDKMMDYAQQQHNEMVKEQERQLFEGRRGGTSSTSAVDSLFRQSQSLGRSHGAADEIHEMGVHILESLTSQNETLKNMHRKILDAANTLGVSKSVMRVIENRQFVDKIVVYGGMLTITIVLFMLWYFYL